VLGVWNFKGKNPFGSTTLLADWDHIALKSREVRVVFDNDVMAKPSVRKALDRLVEHLQRKGAHVAVVDLPQAGGQKVGADEYLLTHMVQDLEGLVEGPRPQPQPAKPITELLDEEPPRMTRLLALIEGRGYAATWLPTRTTMMEKLDKDGEVVQLAQPEVSEARRLFVVRDDGTRFGDVSDPKVKPLSELSMDMSLEDNVPRRLLWTMRGLVAYCLGRKPEPKDVFARGRVPVRGG